MADSPALPAQENISYLQQPAPGDEDDDNSGSILDDQVIVIDPSVDAAPQSDSTGSPRAALEEGEDLDDRFNHMLDVENAQSTDPDNIVTIPATTNGEPVSAADDDDHITVTMTSTTTTQQVAQSHNNYHIEDFDSSVKHAVYPSPETDKMISWGIFFAGSFLLLIALLKMILGCVGTFSYFSIPQYKMKAVYSLLRDLAIFVFILSIVLMLHFHSYLDWYHTNIENLLYGLYIFTALWIFSSMVLFYTCYVRLETFLNYETISQDQEKLRDLKNVYEAMVIDDQNISSSIRSNLNFQIMRQGFICPVELPILSESFLRRDFNF